MCPQASRTPLSVRYIGFSEMRSITDKSCSTKRNNGTSRILERFNLIYGTMSFVALKLTIVIQYTEYNAVLL